MQIYKKFLNLYKNFIKILKELSFVFFVILQRLLPSYNEQL